METASAAIHRIYTLVYEQLCLTAIDITPTKVGPPVVPGINLNQHLEAPNANMVTCGGQGMPPIVAAVRRAADEPYEEIVSAVTSNSAGAGTRANIDEFMKTTSACLEEVGGAAIGKAIMILDPANPPALSRLEGWHRCYRDTSWRMKLFDRASIEVNCDRVVETADRWARPTYSSSGF